MRSLPVAVWRACWRSFQKINAEVNDMLKMRIAQQCCSSSPAAHEPVILALHHIEIIQRAQARSAADRRRGRNSGRPSTCSRAVSS